MEVVAEFELTHLDPKDTFAPFLIEFRSMPKLPGKDLSPIIQFDSQVEVSPFLVFRRLREGEDLLLVDLREPLSSPRLKGSIPWSEGWVPPRDRDILFYDDDGSQSVPLARRYIEEGHGRIRALFGGMELWAFALDPEVLGEDTFLED